MHTDERRSNSYQCLSVFIRGEIWSNHHMGIKIAIPTPLRQFAGGSPEVEVNAATAGDALRELTTEYGELRKHLYNEQDNLRNFINVYVGDEDIRHLDGPSTRLKDGETITIVPSIAGGSTKRACGVSMATRSSG